MENEKRNETYLTAEELDRRLEHFRELLKQEQNDPGYSRFYHDMLAQSLGQVMLKILDPAVVLRLAVEAAETKAIKALRNIREILNDDTLDDPTCFQRIEKIICEFEDTGTYVRRHDF